MKATLDLPDGRGVSAPVFQGESVDPAEVFGVIGNNGPLMAQSGGGDEDIGDADRCSLIEQSRVDAGGDPGARGIEVQDLQGGYEARDFGAFILPMFGGSPVRALEELELGDNRNAAIFRAEREKPIDDLFAAPQDIDADVGIEDPLHSTFST
jgi:hypothetical protein